MELASKNTCSGCSLSQVHFYPYQKLEHSPSPMVNRNSSGDGTSGFMLIRGNKGGKGGILIYLVVAVAARDAIKPSRCHQLSPKSTFPLYCHRCLCEPKNAWGSIQSETGGLPWGGGMAEMSSPQIIHCVHVHTHTHLDNLFSGASYKPLYEKTLLCRESAHRS